MQNIQIIRSNRKTISIEIKPDLAVVVRAPIYASDSQINAFIRQKQVWISEHLDTARKRLDKNTHAPKEKFTAEQLNALADKARDVISQKARQFADIMDVSYGRITIRNQTSRWGSCSSKKSLNFNCLLMLCPDSVVDYVVIHELCHLKQMNHSPAFWALVQKYCPSYADSKKWLKDNGQALIERLK